MKVGVLGGGGHAKVVISTLRALDVEIAGVFDDDPAKQGHDILGISVVGRIEDLCRYASHAIVGIGDNRIRQKIVGLLEGQVNWFTAIHPGAVVDGTASIGEGCVVYAGSVIQPCSEVGGHTIVNTGASVDHDCVIGQFSHVAPGSHLAGGVYLGKGCFVGVGSSIIPNRHVGSWSTIGAGATVVHDIPGYSVAVGTPARVIRSISSDEYE